MEVLYPAISPYREHALRVDAIHTLHVEECGNPDGIPALFLHGGPGAGCTPLHRRFFDPDRYRIVLFDQRGCGKSEPHAALENNTTRHLVADIETIRDFLEVDRWLVFGGSWGSTLALAYAQCYPERVLALVLRGIFLCRDEDIHWFYQYGTHRLFPEYWRDFVQPIPEAERDRMLEAFHKRLTGGDADERLAAAKAWSLWEGRTATLLPDEKTREFFARPAVALSMARIECHYFIHHAFLRLDQLLEDAPRLRNIPGVIVHGRYDSICPVDQAFALKQAWPEARLHIIPDAGHAATEPGIAAALIQATNEFAAALISRNPV